MVTGREDLVTVVPSYGEDTRVWSNGVGYINHPERKTTEGTDINGYSYRFKSEYGCDKSLVFLGVPSKVVSVTYGVFMVSNVIVKCRDDRGLGLWSYEDRP